MMGLVFNLLSFWGWESTSLINIYDVIFDKTNMRTKCMSEQNSFWRERFFLRYLYVEMYSEGSGAV